MNKGVNKVMLLGNVGQDPRINYFSNGNAAMNFSLATSYSYKDKQTDEWVDKTEWHNIFIAGKLAEIMQDKVRKGTRMFVEGQLFTEKWEDKSGATKYTTKIKAFDVQLLDKPEEVSEPVSEEVFDDDIPF